MKYKIIFYIVLCMPYWSVGQDLNFIESPATKSGKVFIPKEIVDDLPTNDSYTLGYFIAGFGLYQNVGQVELVAGEDKEILLGKDAIGNNGYKEGDTLITVLRNNVTSNTYFVEFNYTNNAHTYYTNYEDSVISIKKSTWDIKPFFSENNLCTIDSTFTMDFPYGLTPAVQSMPASGIVLNTYTIDIKASIPGDYTIIYTNEHTWNTKSVSISILEASDDELKSTLTFCEDQTALISALGTGFTRTPLLPTTGFEAVASGEMYFTVQYDNGCETIDTVTVIEDVDCDLSQDLVLDVHSISNFIEIKVSESFKILDRHGSLVYSSTGPSKWFGDDNTGSLLPMGVYFLIIGSDNPRTLTIVK